MIPEEAVEAAAAGMAAQAWGGWEMVPDAARRLFLRDARIALEAAAPHMLAADPVVTDEMVDAVLEHDGTPRRRLFEYPHRADDSRDMIRSAEALVRTLLNMRPPHDR